jgi:hypothetical protein
MKMPQVPINAEHAGDAIAQQPVKPIIFSPEQAFIHMTRKRSDKEQLLYRITDDVLFNVWDAACLSIDQQYREEYLPYLPHVFDLLRTTRDGLDLYDYLVFLEETEFGSCPGDTIARRRASRVVDLLLEYRDAIFSHKQEKFKISGKPTPDGSDSCPA